MCSGERPIGAAEGKQTNTMASCSPPPPPQLKACSPPVPNTSAGCLFYTSLLHSAACLMPLPLYELHTVGTLSQTTKRWLRPNSLSNVDELLPTRDEADRSPSPTPPKRRAHTTSPCSEDNGGMKGGACGPAGGVTRVALIGPRSPSLSWFVVLSFDMTMPALAGGLQPVASSSQVGNTIQNPDKQSKCNHLQTV